VKQPNQRQSDPEQARSGPKDPKIIHPHPYNTNKINGSSAANSDNPSQTVDASGERGDLLVRGFWENGIKSRISLACVRATHHVSEVLEPPSAPLVVKYNGKMKPELVSFELIDNSQNDRSTLNLNYNVKSTMEDTSDVSQQPPFSTHMHWQTQTSPQHHNCTNSHS
jgi:hypothetical protein